MTKVTNSPSIAALLLATLGSGRSVRRFHSILRNYELERYKKESIQVELSRLNKKGWVDKSKSGWFLTKQGKVRMKQTRLSSYIKSPFQKDSPNAIIISFDIPEPERILRRWLRNQIKIFGYTMPQQSLWIGPGPLPFSFLKRLDELGIRKNIKTFKINKK